jgi:hypothetical protein
MASSGPLRQPLLAQKVFQQLVSVLGEDGFRMKLQAFDRESFVAHAHDLPIFSPCSDFKAFRKALALYDQRMIASRGERVGQITKYAGAIMKDRRSFAMHELPGMDDFPAESLPYALVPQADA